MLDWGSKALLLIRSWLRIDNGEIVLFGCFVVLSHREVPAGLGQVTHTTGFVPATDYLFDLEVRLEVVLVRVGVCYPLLQIGNVREIIRLHPFVGDCLAVANHCTFVGCWLICYFSDRIGVR